MKHVFFIVCPNENTGTDETFEKIADLLDKGATIVSQASNSHYIVYILKVGK